jgi:hypothetical protein
MATHHAFPMKGTIGKITFLSTKDGHLAKETRPISAERPAKDPQFAGTRENMKEFGSAEHEPGRQSIGGPHLWFVTRTTTIFGILNTTPSTNEPTRQPNLASLRRTVRCSRLSNRRICALHHRYRNSMGPPMF